VVSGRRELKTERPGFSDIERTAGAAYLRAHYCMASHNVDCNPRGVFFKLGFLCESPGLLVGPSNAGLAGPDERAGLAQVSAPLGGLQPALETIVAMQMVAHLVAEIRGGVRRGA
jgi:hypothetical protein